MYDYMKQFLFTFLTEGSLIGVSKGRVLNGEMWRDSGLIVSFIVTYC